MKDLFLQQALLRALLEKSALLDEPRRKCLLEQLPLMAEHQLNELQKLVGGEEEILLHPRDLDIEELLETADQKTLSALDALLDASLKTLRASEKTASEDQDAVEAESILRKLS